MRRICERRVFLGCFRTHRMVVSILAYRAQVVYQALSLGSYLMGQI